MRKFLVAAFAVVVSVGPAIAVSSMGQLKDVAGTVYVNRGAGFLQVEGATEFFEGDRVLVGEDGSASLSYFAGCDVPLAARSVTTISATAPCQPVSELPTQGASSGTGSETLLIAGGAGLAAAAAAGGIIALTSGGGDNDDDNGMSP